MVAPTEFDDPNITDTCLNAACRPASIATRRLCGSPWINRADVTAIDISPDCVTIMRERGVRDAQAVDLHAFTGGPFDTIVNLCNGLDKVGCLADLPRFFVSMRRLLAPGGQLIADSFDLRVGADATSRAVMAQKTAAGRYFGEMDMRFEYKGQSGAPFSVLQVDYESLARVASEHDWSAEKLGELGGHYLARLVPAP